MASCSLIGLTLSLFWAAIQPNYFISEARLHYSPGPQETSPPSVLDANAQSRYGFEILQSEIHILDSQEVYERVAKSVPRRLIFQPYDPRVGEHEESPWLVRKFHDFQAWWFSKGPMNAATQLDAGDAPLRNDELLAAVKILRKGTKISSVDYSWVIQVTYQSYSPMVSRTILTQILAECINRHREVYYSPKSLEFLEKQVAQLQIQWTTAKESLRKFQKECKFIDIEVQQQGLLTRHAEIQTELGTLEADIVELEAELRLLEEQLERTPLTTTQLPAPTILQNPEYQRLRDKLDEKVEERTDLANRYGEGSERVGACDREIDRLQAQLTRLEPTITQAARPVEVPNPARVSIESEILRRRTSLAGLKEKLEFRRVDEAAIEEEVQRSVDCEVGLVGLEGEEQRLGALVSDYQTDLDSQRRIFATQQAEISNLLILEPASFPSEKSGPKRQKLILLGLLGGTAIGVLFVVAMRAFNHRILEAEDIRRWSPARLVVTVGYKGELSG